jgi:alginate O-acetyltransferase complex protein AlgI
MLWELLVSGWSWLTTTRTPEATILFCSPEFFLFFAIVFALYWAVPWPRCRVGLLLLASFVFYACWSRWLAILVFATSLLDYGLGRGLEASVNPRWRRLLLATSLIVNLALLAYLKYANFFLQSLEASLQAAGGSVSLGLLPVILPIGISFYTFEAISYTVDVYRRRIRAERNPAHFLLFITFFPHLVAGPIVRARDFLPQVRRRKHWSWLRLQLGAQLFLMGLFKKLAIADRMAVYADPIFQDPALYRTGAVWLGVIAYALQIYCDFSGYSDMALGTAHMLGYKLAANFNMPYLSANITEFWRRWHMSLSSWLRDYLFIPLGGSRGSRWLTYRNLLVTMTLGGLWHGASWTFVAWGVLHGFLLIGHRWVREVCQAHPRLDACLQTRGGTLLRMGTTFSAVALGWVLFRAPSFEGAATICHRLFVPQPGLGSGINSTGMWATLGLVAFFHYVGWRQLWHKWQVRVPAPALGVGYAVVFSLALLLAPDAGKAFIYFQF